MLRIAIRIVLSGLAGFSEIKGCGREEVDEVRASFGFPLPGLYEAFLRVMGRGAGRLYVGTDIFYPEVLGNREAAEDLLGEDGVAFTLSPRDFVFSMHQGYQFMYFTAAEGEDDPPVYYYTEGGSPVRVADRLSEFLMEAVREHWGSKPAGIEK